MKNNILFLGGAGFIGSNLVHRFLECNDYNIYVFEPYFANTNRITDVKGNLILERGTLNDFEKLSSFIDDNKINIVVNLVSTLIPGSTYDDYIQEFQNVIFPTARIMEYCADKGIKFIYFSSGGTIYGNNLSGDCFKETDIPTPISYYGLSKQIIENNILFENRRDDLKYLILRPSNPFGPGQSLNGKQGLIAVCIGKILTEAPIEIWGDGSSIRDYIYIDDLSDAFYKLIKSDVENETINIGSGFGYTINDIIDRLSNISEKPLYIRHLAKRSIDVNSMVLNIDKLNSMISVNHTHLEEGMKIFFDYAKTQINK